MRKTKIQWTDKTWNVFRGCSRVSEGCRFCYAERIAARYSGPGEPYEGLANFVDTKNGKDARWTGKIKIVHHLLDAPLKWTKPSMVFVNSMSDVFHENIREYDILKVFDVMNQAAKHTFQILTKRPERLLEIDKEITWTPNIWMGVSIESNKTLHRMETLGQSGANVKFISAEPLLEDVCPSLSDYVNYVDWVIVGGESGPNARPMERQWAIDIYDICKDAGVAYFFKQMGGRGRNKGGSTLELDNGHVIENEYPVYHDNDINNQAVLF